ncbi:hypothetical protein AUJ65_00625 [Candidatus Micrarchaeota archaeon CG1_02_51_15]|nr:MAG: hypothetical protein AUJ65_00625 [Candidatus Micrarchaeota archaeon CG1_02_51_15]
MRPLQALFTKFRPTQVTPVLFLDFNFSRKTMTIPTLRKQHIITPHAMEACTEVNITPIQDPAHMKLASGKRRRRIDKVNRLLGIVVVKRIDSLRLPIGLPLLLHSPAIKFSQRH